MGTKFGQSANVDLAVKKDRCEGPLKVVVLCHSEGLLHAAVKAATPSSVLRFCSESNQYQQAAVQALLLSAAPTSEVSAVKAPVLSSEKHQKDGSRSESVSRRSLRDSSREGACARFRKASEGWLQIRRHYLKFPARQQP